MKLKACAHLANHFCLMNSIPFPVLYNVLSRSYVKQSLKRNEAHHLMFLSFVFFHKSPEPVLITQDLILYCYRKYIFFSSKKRHQH